MVAAAIRFFRAEDRRGTGVNDALDQIAPAPGDFKDVERSHHIDHRAAQRVGSAEGHLDSRQMEHVGNAVIDDGAFHIFELGNVALKELNGSHLLRR